MRENIEQIRDKSIEMQVPFPWALRKKKNRYTSLLGFYRNQINEQKRLLAATSGLDAELVKIGIKRWEKMFDIDKSYLEYLSMPEQFRGKGGITDWDIERARARDPKEFLQGEHGRGNIRCLFTEHEDKLASMQVFDDGLFCHGCNRQMDTIKLIQVTRGMDFTGAVRYLAR